MTTQKSKKPLIWYLDLPDWYFEDLGDHGLILGDDSELNAHVFSGDWKDYEYGKYFKHDVIVHSFLKLKNTIGIEKTVHIPKGEGRSFCFTEFTNYPDIANFPSIFEAREKLVCYCHCTTNWDGLMNSSIVTVDIESERFYNQYWSDDWLSEMVRKIPNVEEINVEEWSNGGVQLYLNDEENQLLIHSDYNGNYEASMLFNWTKTGWKLEKIVPGCYPKASSEFGKFVIGSNSLVRNFTGRE